MPTTDDRPPPPRGRASAFQLLKAWWLDRRGGARALAETEFLNTRDGHELARFAKKAFGKDAAQDAARAAVEAEQGQIDALLAGSVQRHTPAAVAPAAAQKPPRAAGASATGTAADPAPAAAPDPMPRTPVELAVRQLEVLRAQGLSVETLAEALIIIETREVKQRAARPG